MIREIVVGVVTLVLALLLFTYIISIDLGELKDDAAFKLKDLTDDSEVNVEGTGVANHVQIVKSSEPLVDQEEIVLDGFRDFNEGPSKYLGKTVTMRGRLVTSSLATENHRTEFYALVDDDEFYVLFTSDIPRAFRRDNVYTLTGVVVKDSTYTIGRSEEKYFVLLR